MEDDNAMRVDDVTFRTGTLYLFVPRRCSTITKKMGIGRLSQKLIDYARGFQVPKWTTTMRTSSIRWQASACVMGAMAVVLQHGLKPLGQATQIGMS